MSKRLSIYVIVVLGFVLSFATRPASAQLGKSGSIDNLFHGDRFRWSARVTVINITNKETLYNFLSTFSRTHSVSPRAVTGELGFHF